MRIALFLLPAFNSADTQAARDAIRAWKDGALSEENNPVATMHTELGREPVARQAYEATLELFARAECREFLAAATAHLESKAADANGVRFSPNAYPSRVFELLESKIRTISKRPNLQERCPRSSRPAANYS